MLDVVFHRQCEIVFSVENARNRGDRATRNQLASEDNATPPGVRRFFADVKAKIHFLEIAMERNWQTE